MHSVNARLTLALVGSSSENEGRYSIQSPLLDHLNNLAFQNLVQI